MTASGTSMISTSCGSIAPSRISTRVDVDGRTEPVVSTVLLNFLRCSLFRLTEADLRELPDLWITSTIFFVFGSTITISSRTTTVMVVPTDTLKVTFETVLVLVLLNACVTSVRCSVFRLATAFVEVFDEVEVDDVLVCRAAEPEGCAVAFEPDWVLCCCEEPV